MDSISVRVLGKLFWEQSQWRWLWEWWIRRLKSLMSSRNGRTGKDGSASARNSHAHANLYSRQCHQTSRWPSNPSMWEEEVVMHLAGCSEACGARRSIRHTRVAITLVRSMAGIINELQPSLPPNPNSISIRNARDMIHQMVSAYQKKPICCMWPGVPVSTCLWIQVKGSVI